MKRIGESAEWYKRTQNKVWEYLHRQGKARFILLYGVLLWGGIMFIAMTLLESRRGPGALSGIWTVIWVALQLCLYFGGGYISGFLMWRRIERDLGVREKL